MVPEKVSREQLIDGAFRAELQLARTQLVLARLASAAREAMQLLYSCTHEHKALAAALKEVEGLNAHER